MRAVMYNRYFYCIKTPNANIFTTSWKKVFDSNFKENHFVVSKMLNFLISVLFTRKLNILTAETNLGLKLSVTKDTRFII